MGLFDNLFGEQDRQRDIRNATRQANRQLLAAQQQAQGVLSEAERRQLALLQQAQGMGRQDLEAGFGSADQFLGGAGDAAQGYLEQGYGAGRNALMDAYNMARGDISQGMDVSRGDINAGSDAARAAIEDFQTRSGNVLNPFIERGTEAGNRYMAALGLGSAEDQQAAFNAVNPYLEFEQDRATQALQRSANARGQLGDPRTTMAVTRATNELGYQAFNDTQNRLQQLYSQAQSLAAQQSGQLAQAGALTGNIEQQRGRDLGQFAQTGYGRMADLSRGLGDSLGQSFTNQGISQGNTAMQTGQLRGSNAQNRGITMSDQNTQNLINQSNVIGQGANSLANLVYGGTQQRVNNNINATNAIASMPSGLQQTANLIGTGLQAYNAFKPV